jgi:hypothetical protein
VVVPSERVSISAEVWCENPPVTFANAIKWTVYNGNDYPVVIEGLGSMHHLGFQEVGPGESLQTTVTGLTRTGRDNTVMAAVMVYLIGSPGGNYKSQTAELLRCVDNPIVPSRPSVRPST